MKVCSVCKVEKQDEDFSFRVKSTGQRRAACKSCVSSLDKKNYISSEERRVSIRSRAKDNRKTNQEYVINHLLSNSCVDCGESDIVVLEFDHVRGKKSFNVCSKLTSVSLETLKKEIDKCEVRCANCHRRASHVRLGKTYRMPG